MHRNSQQSSTSKECTWKRQGKTINNASAIEELKIVKSEYGKKERDNPKPKDFDPRSIKHNPLMLLERFKEGLEETGTPSVILLVLPCVEPVTVSEEDLKQVISQDKYVENEEEVSAVDIYTIMQYSPFQFIDTT